MVGRYWVRQSLVLAAPLPCIWPPQPGMHLPDAWLKNVASPVMCLDTCYFAPVYRFREDSPILLTAFSPSGYCSHSISKFTPHPLQLPPSPPSILAGQAVRIWNRKRSMIILTMKMLLIIFHYLGAWYLTETAKHVLNSLFVSYPTLNISISNIETPIIFSIKIHFSTHPGRQIWMLVQIAFNMLIKFYSS